MPKIVSIDHPDPVIRTHMLFIQVAIAATKYADSKFYRKHRLSMIKFIALKVLELNGGTMKHSELARWTNTKKHNITTLVDRMKDDKFVTTERSTRDKRVIEITLTDKGREMYQQSSPDARDIIKELMRGLNEREINNFEKALLKIKTNIEKA